MSDRPLYDVDPSIVQELGEQGLIWRVEPDTEGYELGRFGPFIVERTAHDDRIGWVLTVGLDCSNERVVMRTSPEGYSGIRVERVLFSEGADDE